MAAASSQQQQLRLTSADSSCSTLADSTCYNSVGQRKVIRLFICHENGRDCIDVPEGKSVAEIKQFVKDRYKIRVENVRAGDINFERNTLVLAYAGAELPDNWILSDTGIRSGSTLRAYVKEETDPVLYLQVGFSDETIPIMEKLKLRNFPVASLRAMASRRSGLPVGIFRLVSSSGVELFDWHTLDVYDINPGDTVQIQTWDGWNEFLQLAALGFTQHLLDRVATSDESMTNFQLRVALYMAAHFGHVELSTTLTRQRGIRCDEAVGQHPLKQWCIAQPHPDLRKTPIHEAVEAGQLSVLRSFVHHDVCSIVVRDGNGLQPLNLALRQKQKKCASFLLTKQWSRITFGNSTVPLAIFARMKSWCDRAKDYSALLNPIDSERKLSKRNQKSRNYPLIGQGVYIDGYSPPQLNSSKRWPPAKPDTELMRALDRYYQKAYGNPEDHFRSIGKTMKLPKQLSKWSKMASMKEAEEPADRQQAAAGGKAAAASAATGKGKGAGVKANRSSGEEATASHPSSVKSLDQRKESVSQQQQQQQQQQQRAAHPQAKRQASASMLAKAKGNDTIIPLPLHSVQDTPKPYQLLRKGQLDEAKQTLDRYYANRGANGREYAVRCLSMAQNFKEKAWLHRVQLAMSFTEAGARRMTSRNSHNLLSTGHSLQED